MPQDTMIKCDIIKFNEISEMFELKIYYSFHETPFGKCLIAYTNIEDKGDVVCHLSYDNGKESDVVQHLKSRYPGALFIANTNATKKIINAIFYQNEESNNICISVLLKGTDFQMQVWEALTQIPTGTLYTYEELAKTINKPKAARAVASALKANQIGYLIPCHRVVCKSGCNKFSWCTQIKEKMQEYEKTLMNNGLY
ncbi:methylated-DNA--protein-cysteine methyltransferase, inducible [Phymastichus coffea]|uniref:methylated-DNA--protein-cysteine methyltransferase, inducible n=1 Tax=Phymastichus coffea TaxID=108790 RepID=UPI00273C1ADE|nr:methylated-DNA--protein-cysteine methyltransferase, inducible [Phymastichus coffea]